MNSLPPFHNATGQRGDLLPLTRSQLMIWTGQQLQADDPLYNMVLRFSINGELDTARFVRAFSELLARSDALRATLTFDGNVPKQRFPEHVAYELPVLDFSAKAEPLKAIDAWVADRCTFHIDGTGLLFDTALLKASSNNYVWYFNQHHIITDAWSVAVIYERLHSIYADLEAGEPNAPELPSFQDYCLHETHTREQKAVGRASDYWRKRLGVGFQPSTFYRRPPTNRRGMTRRVPVTLGAARSAQLRALADHPPFQAFTPDMAHLQLFATVLFAYLYRVSGNRKLSIGTPSHNRLTPTLKKATGLFIEILPLITDVEEGETFATLHAKVARVSQELLMNAHPGVSSFEHNRAYDVLLNFITASFGDFAGFPTKSEWIHSGYGDRNHLLRMQVQDFDRTGEFGLYLDLNIDTFVGDEQRWAGEHFIALMDTFLNDPYTSIDSCALVMPQQRQQVRSALPEGASQRQSNDTVLSMFAAQVSATPDSIALVCEDQQMSFSELDDASTNVARHIVAHASKIDTKTNQILGVAMNRSIDAVVAILAALKSGAAYVPIDMTYPTERIAHIVSDAGLALVLTHSSNTHALPVECLSLYVDTLSDNAPTGITLPVVVPAHLAYVIYTSGSTGQPKGVAIGHDSLAGYLTWGKSFYVRNRSLSFPLFSSLSFDLTVTSLFLPLISGGRIVVYPEPSDHREITIRRIIEDNAVDIIKLTPAHLSLIQSMDFSASRLQTLIVGGEDFKTDLAREISRRFGDNIEIFNEYGPTEGTVACTVHRYDPLTDTSSSVPIGRPLGDAEVYVLNEAYHVQPQGVTGQLFIGGAGVARGYLNRPDLTTARFVNNPFRAGEKMYATGDLTSWNAQGQLEYFGRQDQQVKIRGVRVEPGEVEAALLQHEAVRECVVVAYRDAGSIVDEQTLEYCVTCGLASNHPHAHLDHAGVCRICRTYESERDSAASYFNCTDDLRAIVDNLKSSRPHGQNCMVLLSGGKDSTYALCQLVEMGLTPLAFTLDNGFISEDAKANIRRVTDKLGLELVEGKTPAMNAIFADSLKRHSNVCNGCFKTIYTLSINLAHERGLDTIFTGLSRGQIFESRVSDLFQQRVFSADRIDKTIIEARKAYHRVDDAVSRNLDVSLFREDEVFEKIRFVDYYRYTEVTLDEMLHYLSTIAPWIRPRDTGRSTNCLINEAGIYVHKKERGYHNYALPYSWDVRLGHKERNAALEELDDDIDVANVERILKEVGYELSHPMQQVTDSYSLVAYYVADRALPPDTLTAYLAQRLPQAFVPRTVMHLERLPLNANGKVDRDALPEPDSSRPQLDTAYAQPVNDIERTLVAIWERVLGLDQVGRDDDFFELGGDSILNIQIVALARDQGLEVTPQQLFDYPTVAGIAAVCGETAPVQIPDSVDGKSLVNSNLVDVNLSAAELDDIFDEFGQDD